ncbi:MAG TPA: PHP domain-containing protein [Candidatus Nanoarchaeia archaeon]|nr:PHP domain-containing protein [Candidatus Nanoarchaeia archaeon]
MEQKKYIDLHTHTAYSDGISSPRELVTAAKLKGTNILALTDHDTIAGYEEAKNEAERWGLGLISGAELTTPKYHLLALNFDAENRKILEMLDYSKSVQEDTCRRRTLLLADYGMPIGIEKVKQYFPKSRLGKYNILMTMLLDRECRQWIHQRHNNASAEELMSFYLRKGGVAGSLKNRGGVETGDAIKIVHNAGGIAILAHPPLDVGDISEVELLRMQGMDGIEVQLNFYEKGYKMYEDYAKQNELLVTYGSDYHGPSFTRPLLGRNGNIASRALEERLLKREVVFA